MASPPWTRIDTVLLDMDGTLLDLRFDNHFWLEHLPARWAALHGREPAAAREELLARYREVEGTLAWYCVEHWSRALAVDVVELKREVEHLIRFLPDSLDFLAALRQAGKRVVLATNAHPYSLALKAEKTGLGGHFDVLVSAHEFGVPKEHPKFWAGLQARIGYDPPRTLFLDDSLPILRAARDYGHIGHLVSMLRPDSAQPLRARAEFAAVLRLGELLPVLPSGE